MSFCVEHQEERVEFGGRVRCVSHHRFGNRAASIRYGRSEKGRSRYTRHNWRRLLGRTRARIGRDTDRIRQLESELGVFSG